MKQEREFPPLLTSVTAIRILKGSRKVSLDLGLTRVDIHTEKEHVTLPDGTVVSFRDLEKIEKRSDAVFFPQDGVLFQVAISNEHFYKLVPTEGAPTLEIDGIRMHRTKEITPEVDALNKIKALGVRYGRILDTCTGLGYTTLAALKQGGSLVVSIELKPEALRIAMVNPWSHDLFLDERVHLLRGDSYKSIDALPDEFFDYIVHDPPRLAHAGHLYSRDFYAKMYRVLRTRGRLFHYIGEPGSKYRRVDLRRGVMQRLRQTGFHQLRHVNEALGVTAEKTRR